MRAVFCTLVLLACLATGCSSGTPSQPSLADYSVGNRQEQASAPGWPQGTRIDNDKPQSEDDEEPVAAKNIPAVKLQRANEIVRTVCSIVADKIRTHESSRLWREGSREIRLAREHERIGGGGLDDELKRKCPDYAALHGKGH